MAKEDAPRVKVEIDVEEESRKGRRRSYTEEDFGRGGRQARSAVEGVRRKAAAFAEGIFPGHGNAIIYGVLGFLVAILIFILGFWRTLFVAFLVVVGVAFGQYLDGNPRILRTFMRFIRSSDTSYPRR